MEKKTTTDESLRRFGAILAAPSLALHYQSTTPALERSFLRRLGLSRAESAAFLELLCESGRLDEGAQAVLEAAARRLGCSLPEAARRLLNGTELPEKGPDPDT